MWWHTSKQKLGLWPERNSITTPTKHSSPFSLLINIYKVEGLSKKNAKPPGRGPLHTQKVNPDGWPKSPLWKCPLQLQPVWGTLRGVGSPPNLHPRAALGMKSMEKLCSFGLVYLVSRTPGFIGQRTHLATSDRFAPLGFECPWSLAKWATVSKNVLNARVPSWWKLVHGLAKHLGNQESLWMERVWFNYWPWTASWWSCTWPLVWNAALGNVSSFWELRWFAVICEGMGIAVWKLCHQNSEAFFLTS